MTRSVAFSLAVTWLLGSSAVAEELVLKLDPEATEITFVLGATGHDVHGHLFLEAGEITFDLDSGAARGEITVDARRADTGNKRRDKTMHKKVLESERYPLFVYRPTAVEGKFVEGGSSEIALAGTLAIHGDEHPLSISIQVENQNGRIAAVGSFSVPYVEWGLHRPGVLFLKVAPEVEVRFETEASFATSAGES